MVFKFWGRRQARVAGRVAGESVIDGGFGAAASADLGCTSRDREDNNNGNDNFLLIDHLPRLEEASTTNLCSVARRAIYGFQLDLHWLLP